MTQASNTITDTQKEYSALTIMRLMLNDYAKSEHISFDEAMYRFTTSTAYIALFDYETGLWREGPDYLRSFWQKCEETQPPLLFPDNIG